MSKAKTATELVIELKKRQRKLGIIESFAEDLQARNEYDKNRIEEMQAKLNAGEELNSWDSIEDRQADMEARNEVIELLLKLDI